ncbi:phage tail sheath subtilisin-like domain-containing protein [Azohydromonas caseinilytica]|uniref:Phage tail sheath protein n=1 Tax=Azohydromonas caseinilytica TaxID=2728836 RepID=A0A848F0U5_9BURK|nr:phage tail sheath subtilisin-like domain-containing protein [Azohydromonas caseinilytica]NML13677.1 phage tail sheath protein [Azohydromonas caseinilytica]
MTLIIPGVEVKVVKDLLAPQLAPSGVLGIVGLTEKQPPGGVGRASSWNSLAESFGGASAYSLAEAPQALANGVFELVVSAVSPDNASAATADLLAADGKAVALPLAARAPGTWANGLAVTVTPRQVPATGADGKPTTVPVFDLTVQRPGGSDVETHRNLSLDPANARYVVDVLARQSQLLKVRDASKLALPQASSDTVKYALANGKDAGRADYQAALAKLVNESDVDMVLVSVQDTADTARLAQIYADLVSHCERMSALGQGRIGFAGIPGATADAIRGNAATLTNSLISDRLVLVAPFGTVGAVAGMVGSLDYFQSPTFKPLALGGVAPIGVEAQQELLKLNAVPVVSQRGRGIIVLRGLTSDGDQISVRRVADHAVRSVKSIGELFIGKLNNELGRGALKQHLTAALVQMEKDGALVPSTDGKDPAFKVDVYCSQDDFAKGIVRVDMAVRPVRAIDYVYAKVLVQI